MAIDLKREFDRRGPWVTRFVIDGREYGGRYAADKDNRLDQFRQSFPDAASILELGSLEGGHTFCLARLPGMQRVVAIEGRRASVVRARFVQGLLKEERVEFVHANLEKLDLAQLGQFDVAFCVGLLYHLPEPWKLLARLAAIAQGLFLWTHYARAEETRHTRGSYRGRAYREWGFLFEPLSGLSPVSFWPTLAELKRMLADSGFTKMTAIGDDPGHPHGPAVTLAARRE